MRTSKPKLPPAIRWSCRSPAATSAIPNFTPPGPVYHMLVVKGYDAQNFITNDVGTRKGESYTYTKDVIMKNMHDWNAQDIHLGAKKC